MSNPGIAATALRWSRSFLLVHADQTVSAALHRIYRSGEEYIVVERQGGMYFYAYRYKEIISLLHEADPSARLAEALVLHEHDESRRVGPDGSLPSEQPPGGPPPRYRFVKLDRKGRPEEVGERPTEEAAVERGGLESRSGGDRRTRGGSPADRDRYSFRRGMEGPPSPSPTRSAPPEDRPRAANGGGAPPEERPRAANGGGAAPARPPEGVDITRHPSITSSGTIKAGSPLAITVDLLLEDTDRETASSGVAVTGLPEDWTEVPVEVQLMSTQLTFPHGASGTILLRRDRASVPCTLQSTVKDKLGPKDQIEVHATFWYQGRFCGHALRLMNRSPKATKPKTRGVFSAQAGAQSPDLNVTIIRRQRAGEGCFSWHARPREMFEGLPDRLEDEIDLGASAEKYARSLFEQCAKLVPGRHMEEIEGLGEKLWIRTPDSFKSVYWAMRKRYGPAFSIQFISDDPFVPWELMRPFRDGEALDILAAAHPVARWIADYETGLWNRLPSGRMVTIAPHYQEGITPLPGAQLESEDLQLAYGASRVIGKRADVLRVLQQGLQDENVAVIHFAGHGEFGIEFADASRILLEDGDLTVPQVSNQRVKLGEKCRTLVIFNACEVGATGAILGMVGGWAEAFTRRKFSGFVAPLWAVIDEDAAAVISELLEAVWIRKEPIGAALTNIRAEHGGRSPTFFSYLFYGDVMARVSGAN